MKLLNLEMNRNNSNTTETGKTSGTANNSDSKTSKKTETAEIKITTLISLQPGDGPLYLYNFSNTLGTVSNTTASIIHVQ